MLLLILTASLARSSRASSTLKWPELQIMAPSFIDGEVLGADDVDVAGDRDEDVAHGWPPRRSA